MLRRMLWIGLLSVLLATVPAVVLAQGQNALVQARVVPDLLFLREQPFTNASILRELPRGLVLDVFAREVVDNNGGSWVLVTPSSGGETGWVLAEFLLFPETFLLDQLPIVDPNDTSLTTSTSAPTTTTTTQTRVTVAGVADGIAGRTRELANFRTGPDLTYEVIRQLRANQAVTLVGRNQSGVWVSAVADGELGWIFYSLVTADSPLSGLPVVGVDGLPEGVTLEPGAAESVSVIVGSSATPPNIGIKPGSDPAYDGRLNSGTLLGYSALVYCVDKDGYTNTGSYAGGGIIVLVPSAGVRLWATEAQINAASSLIENENNFSLYRLQGGQFMLNGPDEDGSGYSFYWRNCEQGTRVG